MKEATLSSVLEAFLSYKPNVNAPSVPLRRTPLIEAIKEKKHHIVDILLEAGADVNFMSPLILAAQLSELSLVTKLVKKGANVKCQDLTSKDGPLHFIASSSCDPREICATLKVLLDAGADMNGKNVQQRTPLHLAVNAHSGKADSSSQVVEFLLDHGADPFAQDNTGSIPLHIAFSKYPNFHSDNKAAVDPIEVVCALTAAMKNRKIDTPDNNGNTPLHRAAQHGATISCMHLIKRVPNINAKNILNNTPLNLAVSMKQEGTTIALLQNDNVDVTNPLKVRARKYAEWEHKIEKFNKYWHWELMKPWPPLKTFNFSLISQVVQRQWHGVLFLLMDHLERAGLSKTAVVEAESMRALPTGPEPLVKIKANKDVEAVNAQGQNLLHILMYIMPTKTTPLHLEVGNELLRRGVGLGLDKHQCSPLTYAALDQSAEFCKMLIDHRREECLQLLRSTDVKGRSPLAAVFWRLDNDMQQLEGTLKFLLECGVTLDQNMPLPRRDLILQEPEMDPDDFYLFWDGPIGQFSPLIGAILARDKSMVKLLLDLGADPNFADPDKVTPLMHAVKMNDLGIIKLLFGLHEKDEPIPAKRKETKVSPKPEMKTASGGNSANMSEDGATEKMDVDAELYDDFPQKIAVTAVDKYGRCAVHYMVNTCKYGTYENEEILAFFAKCKVPLDTKDSSGKTVLDYAKELHLEKLLKGLHKVLNISGEVPLPLVPVHQEVEPPTHRFDIKADAGKMLERLKAQEVGDSALSSASGREAEVDPDSGCTEGSEVLKDKEQNIPYSVYLTVVDVKQGTYGMNLYYKMQIILQREKGKEVFLLFTKSGRVGCVGQHQCTPYTSDASATEEFKKIFKIKTGNVWSQYKEFKPIRGKFKLLVFQVPRSKRSKLSFDISLCPPSKLSQSLKALMTEATQLEPLEAVQRSSEIDMKAMPFGRLDEDVLLKAKGKLEAIRGLLTDFKREETNGLEELRKKNAKMQDIMEKVSDLTMDYYQLIPYSEFNPSEMLPLHTMVNLQQAERVIETLLALELTGKILLGATYHCKDVNILDYTFGALECKIDSLERNSEEAQLILQQIASSGRDVYRSVNVEAIYKLTRRGEQERLNSLNLGNHKLLWHGMKAGHLLSTLKRGLVRSPSEVTSTGIMLGEGIRLSDTFSRGLQYCDAYQKTSKVKFMLLCEVSLGKEHIPEKPGDGLTEGLHHIKGEGSLYPDPRFDLRLPSGVVISMGKLIQGKSSLEFNEYVVQKDSQVRLRYLLQFNQEEH
ncbi:putative poly(ADP-ribose) polymerase pme-5 [Apostichopus japonicus]|uniref:Poly [ADP-ribose] polymerase n=1 Tax=Stichopus japonicus TaxID=307972 RepID=A0A2G8JRU0_STIJA|nr:putative poly(ADP-ribose) polymerase pme-5 [Apostichopus japonicus]